VNEEVGASTIEEEERAEEQQGRHDCAATVLGELTTVIWACNIDTLVNPSLRQSSS
jgi:hypothetical protein